MFLHVRLLCGEKSREKSLGETRFNCGARGRLREKCRRIAWRLRTVRCCAEGSKRAGSRIRASLRKSMRQRLRDQEGARRRTRHAEHRSLVIERQSCSKFSQQTVDREW